MALNSRQLFCLLLVEISPEQLTTTALKRFNFFKKTQQQSYNFIPFECDMAKTNPFQSLLNWPILLLI